jgi:hypothetical protein
MWRGLIAAAIVYGSGHPTFDGYRPAPLDRPLQAFYQEVNSAAGESRRALAKMDDARIEFMRTYIDRAEKQLRSGE